VRLQLHVLAYSLGNSLPRLALPRSVRHRTLTTLRDKLIKIGAKTDRHARYVTLQLAEVAVPRLLYRDSQPDTPLRRDHAEGGADMTGRTKEELSRQCGAAPSVRACLPRDTAGPVVENVTPRDGPIGLGPRTVT
jgi:hypothetical protein